MSQTNVKGGVKRLFTKGGASVYDSFEWAKTNAVVTALDGTVIYEQNEVEFPADWHSDEVGTFARDNFAGVPGTSDREVSLKQAIDRAVDSIARYGVQEGYFESDKETEAFREELKYICAARYAVFDSRLWAAGKQTDEVSDSIAVSDQPNPDVVSATNKFMQTAVEDKQWEVKKGEKKPAKDLLHDVAKAAYGSGVTLRFETVSAKWNTTPSAPDSIGTQEYGLALLDLAKFQNQKGTVDIEALRHAVEVVVTAQEILISHSLYSDNTAARSAKVYRELALSFVGLGTLIEFQDLSCDTEAGRAFSAAIAALITGSAYTASARIAGRVGPFVGYHKDKNAVISVLKMHRREVSKINAAHVSENLLSVAAEVWDEAVELGQRYGVRNSRMTVANPQILPEATKSDSAVELKLAAAIQPFLSGAIVVSVEMPDTKSAEDISGLFIDAWRLGLKEITVKCNNSKIAEQLSAGEETMEEKTLETTTTETFIVKGAVKREMPKRRNSKTYEFKLADLKGFFTVGEYEDGTPGELFITISKQGSTLSGLMDAFARSVSHGLKYGVPLKSYVKSLMGTSYAPAGITDDKDIRTSTSITDYIFRRLAMDYLSFDDRLELGLASIDDMPDMQVTLDMDVPAVKAEKKSPVADQNAPLCFNCGHQTQRSGSCYICQVCGSTSGCS